MENILHVSHIFQTRNEENTSKYCVRHHAITTLSLNACLNQIWQVFSYQIWQAFSYLLLLSLFVLITDFPLGAEVLPRDLKSRTASSDLNYLYFQTFDSFVFSYFNSNILHSIHLFCIRRFFVMIHLRVFCINSSDSYFQTFD